MDDAQTSMVDIPVITPVAPNVPCGMVMVEDTEDEHIANGHAINQEAPLTAPPSSTEATGSPKEIPKQITSFLSDKGIPQHLFAKKVLNRSQGSFSNYLSKAPVEMPRMHSRAIWFRSQE